MTRSSERGHHVFQQLRLQVQDASEEEGQQLTHCITRVNAEQSARQRYAMLTFMLATHPRVGHASAVYRVLRTSRLYDAQLLRHIWQYVYVAEMLPTCEEELLQRWMR